MSEVVRIDAQAEHFLDHRKEVSQRANRVQGRRAGGAYHAARGRQDQGVFDSRQRHAALPKLGGQQTVRTADGPRRPWRFPVGVEDLASILLRVGAVLFHVIHLSSAARATTDRRWSPCGSSAARGSAAHAPVAESPVAFGRPVDRRVRLLESQTRTIQHILQAEWKSATIATPPSSPRIWSMTSGRESRCLLLGVRRRIVARAVVQQQKVVARHAAQNHPLQPVEIVEPTKRNPKRSANASISGTGIISRPVPRSTTTCVLSIITRSTAPPMYWSASVRNVLQSNLWNVGLIWKNSMRE